MPSELYRLIVQGISTGEQSQNVLHFVVDNNDDATPLELAKELVVKWNTTFKPLWLDFQSNRYGLRYIEAKRILPSGGNSYWMEFPEGVAVGDLNEEQGVLQLAPIVKLFAGLTENVQGRCYLPSPPDSGVVDNAIQTAYSDDVLELFDDMIAFTGPDHDWNLAVFSRKLNTGFPVTTCTMSPILGMQERRRKPL